MIRADAASDQPSVSESSPTTQASAEYDVKRDLLVIREVVAAMPNAQVVQLILAGRALPPSELARAEQLYRQALALLVNEADQPHRWSLLFLVGGMLQIKGQLAEAETFFREAHAVARKYHPPDSIAVFETTAVLARHFIGTDRAAALNLALQAEPLIERKNVQRQPLDLAMDLLLVAELFYDLREMERSEKLLLAVVKDPDYERLSYYLQARLLGRLGKINEEHENTALAISYLEQSLAAWKETEIDARDRQEIGVNHLSLGHLFLKKQEVARAEQQFRLASEEFKSTGRSETRAKALTMLGNVLLMQNRHEEARDALADAYKLHKQNDSDGLAYAAGLYGHTLTKLNDLAEAVSVLRDAQLGYSKMPGHEVDVAHAVYQRGVALWLDERPCDSRDVFQEAQALLENMRPAERAELSKTYAVANDVLNMPNIDETCARRSIH